jgi:4-alpha-glucanotransferase
MEKQLDGMEPVVQAALEILGIRNFLLGMHDPAFPSLPEEETGRGSPYSRGAAEFLSFARLLGFNGIQLGPQGMTTPINLSPYDGTFFSKNPLSLAPLSLAEELPELALPDVFGETARLPVPDPGRVDETIARPAMREITARLLERFRARRLKGGITRLYKEFAAFRAANSHWLERDALYTILREEYGGKNWQAWREGKTAELDRHLFDPPPRWLSAARSRRNELLGRHRKAVEDFAIIQFLLARQHENLRGRCREIGLKLFGDFQIGLSGRDAWAAQSFLLRDYVMGAPPSRTNPEGQPWNYPVLDPGRYHDPGADGVQRPGPAILFVRERVEKLLAEFDGLRIDHPHGLVCPWVYRAGQEDPGRAVRQGARLFASPDLADHPGLARYAIARPEQLNREAHRYEDNWVVDLDPRQVERYGILFNEIMTAAQKNSRSAREIACEILSTQPYPIKRVMDLHGLGRFRVTQKADLDNPDDVYRSENARPEDWLMLGNHDTPPVWQQAEQWIESGASRRQALYLAGRLRIPEAERSRWTERVAADAGALVQAKFADLFLGPARNIMVFFTDLLGIREQYNRPGSVSRNNWSLRVHSAYREIYARKLPDNLVLNIPRALAAALRVREKAGGESFRSLREKLKNFPRSQ